MKRELRNIVIGALALGWGVATPASASVMETFSNGVSQTFDGNASYPAPTASLPRISIPVAFGSGNGIIEKVIATLAFKKECTVPENCVDSFFDEIVFRLISPSGSTVGLIEPPDPSGPTPPLIPPGEFTITFDDDEGAPIQRGSLVPGIHAAAPDGGLLGMFVGETADGSWELAVGDTGVGDPLTFLRIDLAITVGDRVPTGQTPEPGTLALLGLGIIGLGLFARRKQAEH